VGILKTGRLGTLCILKIKNTYKKLVGCSAYQGGIVLEDNISKINRKLLYLLFYEIIVLIYSNNLY